MYRRLRAWVSAFACVSRSREFHRDGEDEHSLSSKKMPICSLSSNGRLAGVRYTMLSGGPMSSSDCSSDIVN